MYTNMYINIYKLYKFTNKQYEIIIIHKLLYKNTLHFKRGNNNMHNRSILYKNYLYCHMKYNELDNKLLQNVIS